MKLRVADQTMIRSRLFLHSKRSPVLWRCAGNLVGAIGALYFARAGFSYFRTTHSLVGAIFLGEQLWVVAAYLVRRPAELVSQRPIDWLLATGGTFGGLLFRPEGLHAHLGVVLGTMLQLLGLTLLMVSFISLGRSFGFAAGDRGLKSQGAYSVIRHPVYASYFLLLSGYVLQSFCLRNLLVMTIVLSCDIGRALAEERFLSTSTNYCEYSEVVKWRLVPGIW